MVTGLLEFFDKMPQALPLYEAVAKRINNEFDEVTIKVQKSQITFANKYNFAYVWLPIRKIKGRPEVYIILSFGLNYQVNHPRIEQSLEPYPNRWTHHIIIQSVNEIDNQIMQWIKESYDFSMSKR